MLQHASPEAIQIQLGEIEFAWHETLGVARNADAAALRRAMARLALIYHPDKGGQPDLMRRVNAAYWTTLPWPDRIARSREKLCFTSER